MYVVLRLFVLLYVSYCCLIRLFACLNSANCSLLPVCANLRINSAFNSVAYRPECIQLSGVPASVPWTQRLFAIFSRISDTADNLGIPV